MGECMGERERKRESEREADRERDRQRESETDIQTDRQTDRQRKCAKRDKVDGQGLLLDIRSNVRQFCDVLTYSAEVCF